MGASPADESEEEANILKGTINAAQLVQAMCDLARSTDDRESLLRICSSIHIDQEEPRETTKVKNQCQSSTRKRSHEESGGSKKPRGAFESDARDPKFPIPKNAKYQCDLCNKQIRDIYNHYVKVHHIMHPEQIMSGTGNVLVHSAVDTRGGEATWFLKAKYEAIEKYDDFTCRLCDSENKFPNSSKLRDHYVLQHKVKSDMLDKLKEFFRARKGEREGKSESNNAPSESPLIENSNNDIELVTVLQDNVVSVFCEQFNTSVTYTDFEAHAATHNYAAIEAGSSQNIGQTQLGSPGSNSGHKSKENGHEMAAGIETTVNAVETPKEQTAGSSSTGTRHVQDIEGQEEEWDGMRNELMGDLENLLGAAGTGADAHTSCSDTPSTSSLIEETQRIRDIMFSRD